MIEVKITFCKEKKSKLVSELPTSTFYFKRLQLDKDFESACKVIQIMNRKLINSFEDYRSIEAIDKENSCSVIYKNYKYYTGK